MTTVSSRIGTASFYPAPAPPAPSVADRARSAWQTYHRTTAARDALTRWERSVAADGRPLHTARVACPDAAGALARFVQNYISEGVSSDQQQPVLDYSAPGRLVCVWLLDGEWIELVALDAQSAKPHPPAMPGAPQVPRVATLTPSARLPFTRTPKETPAV